MTGLNDTSGFFVNPEGQQYDRIGRPELICSSRNGLYEIYRADRGGQFRVYKALKEQYRGQPLYENLLHKEFQIGYTLRHPNVCEYVSFLNLTGIGHCIEMEWIDGCSLEEFVNSCRPDRYLYRKIISEICDALSYIHSRQVIHRDLKPSNIMITHNGHNVKLIDFGFSDTDCHNMLKQPAGTAVYAAPELLLGLETDHRADIYSLGCIIAGLSEKTGGIPRHVAKRCTQRNPEKRYRSAAQVKEAVEHQYKRLSYVLVPVAAVMLIALMFAGLSRRQVPFGPFGPSGAAGEPAELPAVVPDSVNPAIPVTDSVVSVTDSVIAVVPAVHAGKVDTPPVLQDPTDVMDNDSDTVAMTLPEPDTAGVSIDELFRQATILIENAGM